MIRGLTLAANNELSIAARFVYILLIVDACQSLFANILQSPCPTVYGVIGCCYDDFVIFNSNSQLDYVFEVAGP